MVIWSRWGILGLLIPTALIVVAILAAKQFQVAPPSPVKQAKSGDEEELTPEEESARLKAAERKLAVEREKAAKKADGTGYLIGGLLSAAVLWPLGRWINKPASSEWSDQPAADAPSGGHTMFFIPLEYWSFFWAVIGVVRFTGAI